MKPSDHIREQAEDDKRLEEAIGVGLSNQELEIIELRALIDGILEYIDEQEG